MISLLQNVLFCHHFCGFYPLTHWVCSKPSFKSLRKLGFSTLLVTHFYVYFTCSWVV